MITEHEYKVRCFCEHAGVDYIPLTAMSEGLYRWFIEWCNNRIVIRNGIHVDPKYWIGYDSVLRSPHG